MLKTAQEFACEWNKCKPEEHDRGTAGCESLAAIVRARDAAWAEFLKTGATAAVKVALRLFFGPKQE